MPQIKQVADSSLGIEGAAGGDGGFVPVTLNYTASIVDCTVFTADRPYVVKAIRGRVDGTALHSSSYNLVGTVNTQQALTLSTTASDLLLAAGDSIAVDVTGTATSAVGNISVTLNPA
jgi:hypothetical protein